MKWILFVRFDHQQINDVSKFNQNLVNFLEKHARIFMVLSLSWMSYRWLRSVITTRSIRFCWSCQKNDETITKNEWLLRLNAKRRHWWWGFMFDHDISKLRTTPEERDKEHYVNSWTLFYFVWFASSFARNNLIMWFIH